MNTDVKNRRKVLVPLATMLVAGAVAVGSGADFTSSSTHTTSVTAGTLHHTNSKQGLALTVTDIKPGDSQSGSLTITNDGSLDSTLSLQETTDSTSFVAGALKLKITDGTTVVYDGDFGGLDNTVKNQLGSLPEGATKTITFTVSMPTSATDANQGATASAGYQYVTTQTGDNSSIGWF